MDKAPSFPVVFICLLQQHRDASPVDSFKKLMSCLNILLSTKEIHDLNIATLKSVGNVCRAKHSTLHAKFDLFQKWFIQLIIDNLNTRFPSDLIFKVLFKSTVMVYIL